MARRGKPDRFLEDRTCVVTGASRGLGMVIALHLARAGGNVVLAARSADALGAVEERLRAAGGVATAVAADVTSPEGREAILQSAEAAFGRVDVLVNNAGIAHMRPFETLSDADISDLIELNLTATLQLTRLVIPRMLAQGGGHVVTIASMAGKVGTPYDVVYAATKAAQISATHALRAEHHGRPVQFSVVCPGFVRDIGLWKDHADFDPPRLLGSTTSPRVAAAVLTAIRKGSPEIYVNSPPSRPMLGLGEWSPRLRERVLRSIGLTRTYARAAKQD